jgi:cytochrome P450
VPDSGVSVDCIIKEAMRLHPPTKRLSRLPLDAPVLPLGGRLGRYTRALAGIWVQAADIEALHRSHDIWGPTPEQFDPARHLPVRLTATQKMAYLPFGCGPLRCVARKWAPRAVGLIVAGIVANEERTITPGEKVGGREGWEGWFVTRTKARG